MPKIIVMMQLVISFFTKKFFLMEISHDREYNKLIRKKTMQICDMINDILLKS